MVRFNTQQWRILKWSGIGLVVVALLGGAAMGPYLSARIIGAAGPRLKVRQGEVHTAMYTTSKQVPTVKLELCQEAKVPTKCVTLSDKAGGSQTSVRIPIDYLLGKALLVVRERNNGGKVTGKIQSQRGLHIIEKKPGATAETPSAPSTRSGGGEPKTVANENRGWRLAITTNEPMTYNTRVPVTVSYSVPADGPFTKGKMQLFACAPFSDTFSHQPPRRDDTKHLEWDYEIQPGQTFTATFEMKVPPITEKESHCGMHVQTFDTVLGGTSLAIRGEWLIVPKSK